MAGQGKGVLRIAIEDFIETFDLGKPLWNWKKSVLEALEKELLDMYSSLFNRYEYKEFMPEMFTPASIGAMTPKQPVQIIPILLGIAMMGLGLVMGMFAPLQRIGMYKIDSKVHSFRPNVLEVFAMQRRLEQSTDQHAPVLDEIGIPPELRLGYEQLSKQLLTAYEYIGAYRRGKQDEAELTRHLKQIGYDDREISLLMEISLVIPGVQDLIRMAVREAFTPETIKRFQYDEAFPTDILQFTRKLGLADEWVLRYWYAHWELISPNQAYEMLHRLRPGRSKLTFTEDDLDLLLKTADYPVFFRERLKAVSYNPITRVDVRRMYKLKIFDAAEVKERYKDLGYADADAQSLADFTVKYEADDGTDVRDKYKALSLSTLKSLYMKDAITEQEYHDRIIKLGYAEEEAKLIIELAKLDNTDDVAIDFKKKFINDMLADVSNAFANRMITEETARQTLSALGISSTNIDFIIQKQNYDADLGSLNINLKYIHDGYISGAIDRNTLVSDLGKLGISGTQQNKLIDDFELELKYRNRRLTEAEYRKAMIQGIITTDDYIANLISLGYTDYDIGILVTLYAPKSEQGA